MRAPRPSAVAGGREAQAVGGRFEDWLDEQHLEALRLGIFACAVVHNQAKTKVAGGRLRYTGKGPADYTGTLAAGARSFAAEAKSTKSGRLPRSVVKKKQAEHLGAIARAGGMALLPIEFRGGDAPPRRYACPWSEVPWEKVRSAESVAEEALQAWRIPDGTRCYLERFVPESERRVCVEAIPRRVFPRE